jgi:small subunit ribosomal protein S4e
MKRHLKRLAAPRAWSIPLKKKVWAVKTAPGPHKTEESVPLLVVVRDLLKYAATGREAKRIIREGQIIVDKKARKDYKFPVGLADIVEIPVMKERKIVLYDGRGKIILKKITLKNSKAKLCRIADKTLVNGGKIQLNLHDGRNLLLDPKDDVYKVKDSILLDLEKKAIKGHYQFKEGSMALITGGKHTSRIAKIKEIRINRGPGANTVVMEDKDGEFQTIDEYVFVAGDKKLAIPEVGK